MACKFVSKKVSKITLCVALPVLAISVVFLAFFPSLYRNVLKKELTLAKGTILTDIWKDIPLPIYERLYFFNITNKEAFLNGREPLSVVEVGPYTYRSKWVKEQTQWNPNSTVTYREVRTYHFVPGMSNGTQEDIVYTLNGPFIIAANIAKDYNVVLRALLSLLLAIDGETVVIKRSIQELVYGGYEDIIIKLAPILKPDIPYKDGIFSWLSGKNATDDGQFTTHTGADNSSKTNILVNWNGEEKLSFWKGDTCNMINGTNVEMGPPIREGSQEAEIYSFFQSILCRSVSLNYTGDQRHFGILSKRYKPTRDLFANSTENPDNYCFEVQGERPSGILSLSSCQFGAPLYISFPHFYMADPSYLESVDGLNPNDVDHGSHLDVETVTGVSIHAAVRFQFNLEISEVEGIFQTRDIRKGLFPVFWVELNLEIDQHMADYLKSKLEDPKVIAYSVLGTLAGLSLILAVTFLVAQYLSTDADGKEDDDDPLIDAVDKEINGDRKVSDRNCKRSNGDDMKRRKSAEAYENSLSKSLEESQLPTEKS